ncbi:hypothetical protein CMI37_19340 [Candidatus Pacearchaeota archaeon]|mgnify:CR=1 FL=1|nr:hypothetical protein [Candidatus Pacearchaeota archaeon]|tara:strand:+ start:2712 stop:3221 length:510 start_codon:yes stop_codon:yes gene_type:complete
MEFKIFLKKSPLARKIFGKRELVIIQKQISGIRLTQSEKNRLSRDIRPKLRFIREVNKFENEFELKRGAENKKLIEIVIEAIREDKFFSRIKEVWLFGSIVTNEMTVRSDVDVAVLFKEITKREAANFRIRVFGRVPDKVDIQVFNVLPEKIKKSILKNHKVLYKKDGK